MSTPETNGRRAVETAGSHPMDMKLEVVVIQVSDVDRAKRFYADLGWRLDADFTRVDGSRAVQLTPPGSPASIQLAAGSAASLLYLIVSDIEAAHAELAGRGVNISEVFHRGPRGRISGPDEERRTYASLATFSDLDGNAWLVQEVTSRLPGRAAAVATFASSNELAQALRRAAKAHGKPGADADGGWAERYADHVFKEQTEQTASKPSS
jgi:catechol 2,3-dioxygenase-like lactoylglutathione lyase family enzyme